MLATTADATIRIAGIWAAMNGVAGLKPATEAVTGFPREPGDRSWTSRSEESFGILSATRPKIRPPQFTAALYQDDEFAPADQHFRQNRVKTFRTCWKDGFRQALLFLPHDPMRSGEAITHARCRARQQHIFLSARLPNKETRRPCRSRHHGSGNSDAVNRRANNRHVKFQTSPTF